MNFWVGREGAYSHTFRPAKRVCVFFVLIALFYIHSYARGARLYQKAALLFSLSCGAAFVTHASQATILPLFASRVVSKTTPAALAVKNLKRQENSLFC